MASKYQGEWMNRPHKVEEDNGALIVETLIESDLWRNTSYGFVHNNAHALLETFNHDTALEVDFIPDYSNNFDQAGILIWQSDSQWAKIGVEYSDNMLQLGAVVTNENSDWSLSAKPEWNGKKVTIRASWSSDAVTVRAKVEGQSFSMIRLFPLSSKVPTKAGLMFCSPSGKPLKVKFLRTEIVSSDNKLH
ncbi:hypothetical protein AKO1_007400 [Acrasis kona]|uniref:DUF1349 domain-containing protein n=1 Tax=Acrasis kona TaxID=1008807 RepID=A0AAW2YS28_9EUKA